MLDLCSIAASGAAMEEVVLTSAHLGTLLRRYRRSRGISQADLGGRLNLRATSLKALEEGEVDAKITTLFKIISALGLEVVVRSRATSEALRIGPHDDDEDGPAPSVRA